MKTLKKLFLLVLTLTLCSLCFTAIACNKENSNPPPSVAGKYYKTASIETGGVTYNVGDSLGTDLLEEDFMLVSFAEDGSCTYIIYGVTGPCTWEQNGANVTVIPTGEPESEYIHFTITNSGLSVVKTGFTVNLIEYTPEQ